VNYLVVKLDIEIKQLRTIMGTHHTWRKLALMLNFQKKKRTTEEVVFFGNLEEMTVGRTDTTRIVINEYIVTSSH
jgi:hypothetical protein